jgi:hypothetical protein
MRATHAHSQSTVIMGGPDKPGHDDRLVRARAAFVLFVFFVVLSAAAAR